MDLEPLGTAVGERTAAVLVKTPTYLGVVETRVREIGDRPMRSPARRLGRPEHARGASAAGGLGADIACGDIQPLGMHQLYGGGHAGFIATHDDPRFVMEFPSRLFGITSTRVEGEVRVRRRGVRADVVRRARGGRGGSGTAAALWGITAGVYLALTMGPRGMVELGEGMMARVRDRAPGGADGAARPVRVRPPHGDFVLDVGGTGRSAAAVPSGLSSYGIFGSVDLSRRSGSSVSRCSSA